MQSGHDWMMKQGSWALPFSILNKPPVTEIQIVRRGGPKSSEIRIN